MPEVKIIVGANFGDEGKGMLTDYYCAKALESNHTPLVVLSNGGAQRGHTVELSSGIRHVFHHFGSGTLRGASTFCAEQFILNPIIFADEWAELYRLGVFPVIYIHSGCRWSTPWDMMFNQIVELSREKRHGSCGCGIWETVQRSKKSFMPFPSFLSLKKETQIKYLQKIRDEYYGQRCKEEGIQKIPEDYQESWFSPKLIDNFLNDCYFMGQTAHFGNSDTINRFEYIVIENGQGLLLSDGLQEIYGDNLTPSITGSRSSQYILQGLSSPARVEICYVSRTYMTRHGNGRFETEQNKNLIVRSEDETNHPNEWQGELRYGELIEENLRKRVQNDALALPEALVTIAFTHANEYNKIDYDRLRQASSNILISDSKWSQEIKKL